MSRLSIYLFIFSLFTGLSHGQTIDFNKDIMPILKASCIKCHGPKKQKGKLRLDSPDEIRKAVLEHKIIEPKEPEKSSFYKLTVLSPDDEDRMPVKGDPLNKKQTTAIWLWIKQGANFGDGKPFYLKKKEPVGMPRLQIDPSLTKKLKAQDIVVTAYGHKGYGMSLRYVPEKDAVKAFGAISEYKDKIWQLDISRQSLPVATLTTLKDFAILNRLDLRSIKAKATELTYLATIKSLRWINLTDANIEGDLLPVLKKATQVESIYLPIKHLDNKTLANLRKELGKRVKN